MLQKEIDVDEVEKCKRYIESNKGKEVSGLMFCNNPRIWLPENCYWRKYKIRTSEGQKYFRRKNYTMIWNHQFLRVKVVRDFFGLFPRVMKQAKEMDYIKDKAVLPNDQHLYMLDHNVAIYGESTNRGIMMKNCAESFCAKGLELPEGFKVSDEVLIKGTNKKIDNFFYVIKNIMIVKSKQ